MTPDPKDAAQHARALADAAEEFVRDLRRMLGKAMADAAEAKRVARELERTTG